MKTRNSKLKIAVAVLLAFIIGSSVTLATPFFSKAGVSGTGPLTNAFQMQAWPPVNTWTVYGTNIIYGGLIITNTPDATGYVSNSVYPNTYRVYYPDLDSGYFVSIPDTTNFLSLSVYATNVAVFAGTYLNGFGLVTNWLGYRPATNGGVLAYSQLPWTPPTNTPAGIVYVLGYTPPTNSFPSLTNSLGFTPATNGGPVAISQLPYTPPTNTFPALTNVLGFTPATNGGPVAVSQLPYTPPTNTAVGILYALNFQPATNTPAFSTTSNPTNQYLLNTIYTNAAKSLLIGFASGTILHFTNNAAPFVLPVTNNFCVALSTNATFKFDNSGFLTNAVNWQLP